MEAATAPAFCVGDKLEAAFTGLGCFTPLGDGQKPVCFRAEHVRLVECGWRMLPRIVTLALLLLPDPFAASAASHSESVVARPGYLPVSFRPSQRIGS